MALPLRSVNDNGDVGESVVMATAVLLGFLEPLVNNLDCFFEWAE